MQLRWHFAQFFELIWWRLYLRAKDKTAYRSWKTAYWNSFLQKSGVAIPDGSRVLDAGCGPAGIFTVLKHCRVDAVDPLLERYKVLLPHFNPGEHPSVRFYAHPLESLQAESLYDVVFCLNAINHVADIECSLDRLVAATKPGGLLVLSVDAHRSNGLQRIFKWFPADVLHPHQHTRTQYEAMLICRGMRLERAAEVKKGRIFSYFLLVATRLPSLIEQPGNTPLQDK